MHNGRINSAFENASSAEGSDSESLGSLVNPTSISALIEDLENREGNGKTSSESNPENYDDLIRNEFIRPWSFENFVACEPTVESTHDSNSNTDILISELKEQLEDEEFLNSELAKKNISLEEEIKRLKVQLEDEETSKNNFQQELEEMQEDLKGIAKKLQEEEETNKELQNDKNELLRVLEESRNIRVRLQGKLRQLREDKADQSELIRQMEVQIQDLQKQLRVSNDVRAAPEEKRGECEEVYDDVYEEVYEEAYEGQNDERFQMQTDDLQNDQQQNRCKLCCLIS